MKFLYAGGGREVKKTILASERGFLILVFFFVTCFICVSTFFLISWCGPCKVISPALIKAYKGNENFLKLVKFNVDYNTDRTIEYDVSYFLN